jgi:primosomal protein N' (replication factor Y)
MTAARRTEEPTMTASPPYAVVIVQTPTQRRVVAPMEVPPGAEDEDPLTRTFHYRIPDALRSVLRIGHLVWVPFGQRRLQGVVAELDETAPVEQVRDILRLADPEPVLSPEHVALARWMSERYLAPLHMVVRAMLPPGVTQRVEVVVRLIEGTWPDDGPPPTASPSQRKLVALLQARGPLTLPQIARSAGLRNYRAVVDQLVHHGWASKTEEVRAPVVRPRLSAVVRAAPHATPDAVPARATRQRAALEYLLARREGGDDWVPVEEVRAEVGADSAVLRALAERGLVEHERRPVWRDPLAGRTFVPTVPPRLTAAQEAAWQRIHTDLEAPEGKPFLLQGVTGSGKTEIYLRAVKQALRQGRSAIVLVPEIALTPQTIRRFGARFPDTLAVMHSHLSPGERYDQWRRMRAGDLRLVVGSRSAIFAPVRNLGLIVLDEEHEPSYKQQQTPNYHARDVAVELARLTGATCVLGSATPALESAYRAERGEYVRLLMPQRIMGHTRALAQQASALRMPVARYHPEDAAEGAPTEAMYTELPPVEVVDMRAELRAGNYSMLSRRLQASIEAALAAKEQVILFLNRRGAATFVMCRDCGHVLKCPRCDLPLTYHSAGHDLICHHCNYTTSVPPQCPSCGSARIKFFGAGTQRLEEVVREAYSQARVIRWDLDTTGGKMAHEEILDAFVRGEADIMIGTQMIAKGLDLPRVTLVGVVSADTMLNLPDYTAGERAFQLLTQVAGRAGRSILGGTVVLQTYAPHHPAVQAASRHDYDAFYQGEMAFRRAHRYPPISRLVRLMCLRSANEAAQHEAEALHRMLTLKIARQGLADIDLIGPAPAFFARVRGRYRWQIVVRGRDPAALLRDLRLPVGWRIDVDPVSLL